MVDFTYQKGAAHIFLIVILLIAAFFTFLLFSSKKDSLKIDPVSSQEEELANFNPKPFQDVSSDNDNYTAIKYLARE